MSSNNNSHDQGQAGRYVLQNRDLRNSNEWIEHRSSNGKLYYYNTRTGVSQWEMPTELRQQRAISPQSAMSESSSIRHRQDTSPSSSASTNSSQFDITNDDKPLLTPNLSQYFKPELVSSFTSSQLEELEQQANNYSKESQRLREKILQKAVDLKRAKSEVRALDTALMACEAKQSVVKDLIKNFCKM